ncbi:hypothetical protein B296_00051808 [Ensete ventricosum]|uniref:Uncharacterized protein n=1 Tax=Ensete ventricosum TaxID=4639 RepID=A0A426X0Q5_ENSVE|nr:hypothetical protein B296_00051808 [Ensete ventricosum]
MAKPHAGAIGYDLATCKVAAGFGQGPPTKGRLAAAKAPYTRAVGYGQPVGAAGACGHGRLQCGHNKGQSPATSPQGATCLRSGGKGSAHPRSGRKGWLPAMRPQWQCLPATRPQGQRVRRGNDNDGDGAEREEEDLGHSFLEKDYFAPLNLENS